MGDKTGIEWTDATWNPIRARNKVTGAIGWHCEHASPGCVNCYSESFNRDRLGTRLPFKPGHLADIEIFLDEAMLTQPLRWKRPRKIFVCSMTDLFGDFVSDAMIDRMFAIMALCPQHTFQVLTKRSARMRAYLRQDTAPGRQWAQISNIGWSLGFGVERVKAAMARLGAPLPNVWLGVSAEGQKRADERVPDLLATPAAIRFVSAEPLLGPIDFDKDGAWNDDSGASYLRAWGRNDSFFRGLDWIIVGGESGPKARPMHPAWVRPIRDQCAAAGVAFLFKQWGALLPDGQEPPDLAVGDLDDIASEGTTFFRVGKKAAGRLLDGREHNDMPRAA